MKKILTILAVLSGDRARQFLVVFAKLLFWATLATVIYLVLGLVMPAHAQTAPDITQLRAATPSGDWSLKSLMALFGDFARDPWGAVGSPTTLLGGLFLNFNAAIFAVSTSWLGYGVLRGIIGTTQDGQLFGQRINSSWYPIRVVTGIGSGVPILGGFTLQQGLQMWVAVLGIGIANSMWVWAVAQPAMTQLVGTTAISGAPAVRPSQVMSAATSMLRSNLCMASYQQEAVIFKAEMERGGHTSEVPPDYFITRTLDAQPGALRIRYGWAGNPEACGSVSVRMDKYREEDSSSFRVESVDYRHIRNVIGMKASQQLIQADDMIRPMAESWLKLRNAKRYGQTLELSVDMQKLASVAGTYTTGIKQLVTLSLENSGSSIKAHAQAQMLDGGWMMAGSYFSTYAEANAALADAISGLTFSSTPPPTEYIQPDVREDLALLEKALSAAADRMYGGSGAGREDQALKTILNDSCAGGLGSVTAIGNCSLGQSIARVIAGSVFNGSGGGQSWRDDIGLVNPVVAMKNAGDYILTIAATFIAIGPVAEIGGKAMSVVGAAATATGVAASPGVAAMALGAAASYIIPFGWTLLIIGTAMAAYIPLLPALAWLTAVFSYFASLLEGFIAAPLHSMSHMHTEGDGLGQATTKGYLFWMNALARPAIMVIGFFAASALVVVGGTLIAKMFGPMIASAQGNSVTGLASIVGYLVVYILANIAWIQYSFNLISVLPDQVIGFLGAGETGQTLGREAESKINAAFMSAGRQGMVGAQGGLAAGSKALQKIKPGAGVKGAK